MKRILLVAAIVGSRAEFGHNGQFASRFEKGLDLAADNVEPESDPIIGCCRGVDSACKTTSETTCDKNAKRKGCEWLWGTGSNPPDCSDPTPEPGCCAGPSDDCYGAYDETACDKLARRQGCEWRAGKEADCTPTTAPPGCCYGEDSKCWDEDEATCAKNARRYGCEWIIGTDGEMPDCTPPTPEPGCCAGEAACTVTWLDQGDCEKLSRREGCEWRAGKDADCTPTTPAPGCCYGENSKCHIDDMDTCLKFASRAGCEWRTDTADGPADCTPPTPEPGCCVGDPDKCMTVTDDIQCNKLARRSGCEWISGIACPEPTTESPTTLAPGTTSTSSTTEEPTTTTTTTSSPEIQTSAPPPQSTTDGVCSSNHRHRVSWQETTLAKRQLYIDGFKALADQGVMRKFTKCHLESSEHSNDRFLPWHREFVYRLEDAIRGLGGKFSCFTMPYWDWTMEPTPYEVKWNGEELFILNSGLGGDGDGQCVVDPVWGEDAYTPEGGACLTRDLDYPDEEGVCTFYSAAQVMEVIDWSAQYSQFRPMIEGTPHALPHVCIGGDEGTYMATYYSPDDPIFYLHHTFVDFIWAVWQDCNNYDGQTYESNSDEYDDQVRFQLDYDPLNEISDRPYPKVEDTFDIQIDYDVSYEKGAFWDNARVDHRENCGAASDPTNDDWFYNTITTLKKHTATQAQQVEQAIIDEVFDAHPEASYEDNIAEAADLICVERENGANALRGYTDPMSAPECVAPVGGLIDCGSDEDAITSAMVLNQPGLSQCAITQRTRLWEWAELMDQKQYLCRGCYDPYCDADSKAAVQAMDCRVNTHSDDDLTFHWDMMALLDTAQNGVVNNVNVLVMVAAVLMMLAAKWCLDRGEMSKKAQVFNAVREESAYGAV